MCSPKEPMYFNTDFTNRLTTSEAAYLSYFDAVPATGRIAGEASVLYLASRVAAQNILAFEPSARFIAMVRNPVEMAYSYHAQNLRNGTEPLADFGAAWRAQGSRTTGRGVPAMCRDRKVLLYGPMCRLGFQVQRLLQTAGPARVHVILFDDLQSDAPRVYRDTLGFLGVADDGRTEFPRMNENAAVRSMFVKHIQRSLHEAKQRWGLVRGLGVLKWLDRQNRVKRRRSEMDPSLRRELAGYFRSDVQLLEEILHRDLQERWLGAASTDTPPTGAIPTAFEG